MDPITIAAIVMAVAGGAQAYQQKEAADAQADQMEFQAEMEESAAVEREVVRKTKLNKILAAQIAGLGASGITAEGSPQVLAESSVRQASLGELAGLANYTTRRNMLVNEAKTTRKLGNLQAGITVAKTAANTALTLSN